LTGSAIIEVDTTDLTTASHVAVHASEHLHEAIGNVDAFTITPTGHHH
jgi:hypothetical protein